MMMWKISLLAIMTWGFFLYRPRKIHISTFRGSKKCRPAYYVNTMVIDVLLSCPDTRAYLEGAHRARASPKIFPNTIFFIAILYKGANDIQYCNKKSVFEIHRISHIYYNSYEIRNNWYNTHFSNAFAPPLTSNPGSALGIDQRSMHNHAIESMR